MKPSNINTSPEQLFFYPHGEEVQHHESLDVDKLPGTVQIGGSNHYVVIESSENKVYGAALRSSRFNIPAGSTIKQIRSVTAEYEKDANLPDRIREDGFSIIDEDSNYYLPELEPGVMAIVQLDRSRVDELPDDRFDDEGVAILPSNEPLPTIDDLDPKTNIYKVLGFIAPDDKFVTWEDPASTNVSLVDWCVADVLTQNSLEAALLNEALPQGAHLLGLLRTHPAAATYLRYYDAKHNTQFMPENDPRDVIDRFPPLTNVEYVVYRGLSELAADSRANI